MTPEPQDQQTGPGERFGLIVTNATKLTGLVIAFNEVVIRPNIRSGAIALAALLVTGAQSLETFLTAFFGSGKKE
jgi:hypothetical protein